MEYNLPLMRYLSRNEMGYRTKEDYYRQKMAAYGSLQYSHIQTPPYK